MADNDIKPPAGGASRGPAGDGAKPSGDTGDGARSRGQGSGGAGGNPANGKRTPTPDNQPPSDDKTQDDGTALLKALVGGTMDELDDDGKAAIATDDADDEDSDDSAVDGAEATGEDDAEPEGDEEADGDDAEADPDAAKGDEDAAEGDEKPAGGEPEVKPEDGLTKEEREEVEAAPKGQRKGMRSLFKERRELRTQIDTHKAKVAELEPAKQWADRVAQDAEAAGLIEEVTGDDGRVRKSFAPLRLLLEQERLLANMPPAKRAEYYRGLADQVYPEGRPVKLPDDLAEKVAADVMSKEEAELIARHRDDQQRGPVEAERRQREEQARRLADAERSKSAEQQKAARAQGEADVAAVVAPHRKKYGPQWDAISKQVFAEAKELLPDVAPSGWAKLIERTVKSVLAKRVKPLKRPTETPTPGRKSSGAGGADDGVISEEDEMRALSAGKL